MRRRGRQGTGPGRGRGRRGPKPTFAAYPDTCTLWQKVGIICREIYGLTDVLADKKLREKFSRFRRPAWPSANCMAKTQYSLSTDPGLVGRPHNFDVPLRVVTVSAGAGFVVVFTGEFYA